LPPTSVAMVRTPLFKIIPPATHMPLLFACLVETNGPVLEYGAGAWSTSLTSAFAIGDRFIRTVEQDKYWWDAVKAFDPGSSLWRNEHGGIHEILHVESYNHVVIDDHDWDIVFLDHNPPERRAIDASRLRDNCRLMVLHDSWQDGYNTDSVLKSFRHCLTDRRWLPFTTVGSDQTLDWLQDIIPTLDARRDHTI